MRFLGTSRQVPGKRQRVTQLMAEGQLCKQWGRCDIDGHWTPQGIGRGEGPPSLSVGSPADIRPRGFPGTRSPSPGLEHARWLSTTGVLKSTAVTNPSPAKQDDPV